MLRRLAVTAVASLAVLSAAAPAAVAVTPVPVPLLPLPLFLDDLQDPWGHEGRSGPGDQGSQEATLRMTVTVTDSGDPAADGTFELLCGPDRAGGTHAKAQAACDRLAEAQAADENPFLPTPKDAMCTQIHGGPATARVVGTWQGRDITAYLNRVNGCEISRWNNLIPVLPAL
ncbi:SSI family serine proteinase inhibitor [Streptomyces sp. 24-1644]|uniref:SSI family serine proteinase inhibitor n=1 Tax=Streptomyces sp. 24-1644 TaxID=3457315 RepID=UPI003FA75D96